MNAVDFIPEISILKESQHEATATTKVTVKIVTPSGLYANQLFKILSITQQVLT